MKNTVLFLMAWLCVTVLHAQAPDTISFRDMMMHKPVPQDTALILKDAFLQHDAVPTLGQTSQDMGDDVPDAVWDTLPPMASGYKWVSYRGKAQITDTGGTRNCNFFMVNRVDSIVYLNVSSSGIEIIRVVCTPDSFIYVNKLTYQYYRGTYGPLRILSHLPVDFQMVQALFNGDETKLPQHQKFSFEYSDYAAVDSTRSFFNAITFKDLDRVISISATLKNIRFDVPGPTGIRIPEKFKELKL